MMNDLTGFAYITTFSPHNKVLKCWEFAQGHTVGHSLRDGTPTWAWGLPYPSFFSATYQMEKGWMLWFQYH